MPLDSKMQCLCCDKDVLVDSDKWNKLEMPIALCPPCAETVPKAAVKVLFVMRSQLVALTNEVTLVKRDIKKLYAAQQELEQALVAA